MMKTDYKKDVSPKYLLLFLTVIAVILIILSAVKPSLLRGVRAVSGRVITPLQEGTAEIGASVRDHLQVFGNVRKLKKENADLQSQVSSLQNDLSRNQAELTELGDLRKLYDLDRMYPDYKKKAARIFSVDTTGWFNEFYIDKGLNDGIYEGCNVICDEGLLGIVTEAYADYARVRAIIDDRSYVTAEIGSEGAICTVEGSLKTIADGYLNAVDIDANASVQEGDRVITSYVSDKYLYGITIGYVTKITEDSNHLTKTAEVTPAVDFNDIRDVLVILDRKQEVDE